MSSSAALVAPVSGKTSRDPAATAHAGVNPNALSGLRTLRVRFQDSVCFVQIHRPEAGNTISDELVAEMHQVLTVCESVATVLVLGGSPEVFCAGADFKALASAPAAAHEDEDDTDRGPLYDLWLRMLDAPFIVVSHVRGKANAGGIGFVAASDIVLADETAQFSLSELLFGLYPAMVLPFLVRRVGAQRAHYLTLMTQPFSAAQACEWGLVDAFEPRSEALLRRHLLRLSRLSRTAIRRYKKYMSGLSSALSEQKPRAVAANKEVFSDPENLAAITRYVERGVFPWERN
jgi:polyketide biosynthesis enoyl-CoA hydratase PksH